MHHFKELKIWQKSRELVKICYLTTSEFPDKEKFGLISQIQRASASIPTNIAEGSGHGTDNNFIRFLEIAYASASELETQIILSFDLNLIIQNELDEGTERITEIQKMLFGLISSLKK